MSKAQEILAQQATDSQKYQWAKGNAVAQEYNSRKGTSLFTFADGSAIKHQHLSGLQAF